jgi:hypothetical protein
MTATIWFYDEANYRRFKEICEDGNKFPATYAAWLEVATKKTAAVARANGAIRKIQADPDDFLLWCKINAVAPNQVGRTRYASVRALSAAHLTR